MNIDWAVLRSKARDAAARAHAPYSGLSVGAAALVDDGRVITGCNVENASFGLTLCAECGLVSQFYETGGGSLLAVSVVDGSGQDLTPCGRCRQLLHEAGSSELMVNEVHKIGDLLPGAFSERDLPERQ